MPLRKNDFKYLLGGIIYGPLLPLAYYQASQIYKKTPKLPEAKDPTGVIPSSTDKKLNLLIIGESTIAGVGVERHEEGFAGTFANELSQRWETDITWSVYAKSGYTAEKVRKEIIPDVPGDSADLIIVGLGGNDAFHLHHPTKWRKDIRALINALRTNHPKCPIIFNSMPPIRLFPAFTSLMKSSLGGLVEILGEELEFVVEEYPQVFYHHQVIVLEDWVERLGVEADIGAFFSDGVHPSKLTYQALAIDLVDFVERQLTYEQLKATVAV